MKLSLLALSLAALAAATPTDYKPKGHNKPSKHHKNSPFWFTSTYSVIATPDQVVNATNQYTGGLVGAKGYYNYGINSHQNVICYNITLTGFRGDYESPATTATHIHEAPKGKSGPPR